MRVCYVIAPPLTYLINMSLRTGTLPGTCKCAKLEALFEQVDRCDKENYRPTSVPFYYVKLIEHFVHLRLYGHLLAQSNLLFDERFSFRHRRYTATAPCQFNEIYLTASGTRTCSHDSFICTSKEAFDTVDHNIFLLKLKAAGVSGIALSWFQSYLASRCERTCNDDR